MAGSRFGPPGVIAGTVIGQRVGEFMGTGIGAGLGGYAMSKAFDSDGTDYCGDGTDY